MRKQNRSMKFVWIWSALALLGSPPASATETLGGSDSSWIRWSSAAFDVGQFYWGPAGTPPAPGSTAPIPPPSTETSITEFLNSNSNAASFTLNSLSGIGIASTTASGGVPDFVTSISAEFSYFSLESGFGLFGTLGDQVSPYFQSLKDPFLILTPDLLSFNLASLDLTAEANLAADGSTRSLRTNIFRSDADPKWYPAVKDAFIRSLSFSYASENSVLRENAVTFHSEGRNSSASFVQVFQPECQCQMKYLVLSAHAVYGNQVSEFLGSSSTSTYEVKSWNQGESALNISGSQLRGIDWVHDDSNPVWGAGGDALIVPMGRVTSGETLPVLGNAALQVGQEVVIASSPSGVSGQDHLMVKATYLGYDNNYGYMKFTNFAVLGSQDRALPITPGASGGGVYLMPNTPGNPGTVPLLIGIVSGAEVPRDFQDRSGKTLVKPLFANNLTPSGVSSFDPTKPIPR